MSTEKGKVDIKYEENGREYYREVKNQRYVSKTAFNEYQAIRYARSVGAENLQYDIYTLRRPSLPFLGLLDELGIVFRVLPYVPVLG